MNRITVIITASNNEDIINNILKSVLWANEIIVIISKNSVDNTETIARKYTSKVYFAENNLGLQRNKGIKFSTNKWILILDSDEVISTKLSIEIKKVISKNKYSAYRIPYNNYFCKYILQNKNQKYKKLRLFRRNKIKIEEKKIHPRFIIKGRIGVLKNPIEHHSFRSIPQIIKKFTYYASVEAPLLYKKGERVNVKKFTMYPAHMFYSIFIKDQGYKDSIWGFGLALSFAYMEFMRYFFLAKYQLRKYKIIS